MDRFLAYPLSPVGAVTGPAKGRHIHPTVVHGFIREFDRFRELGAGVLGPPFLSPGIASVV